LLVQPSTQAALPLYIVVNNNKCYRYVMLPCTVFELFDVE